jgi:hypothetical protein
MNGALSVRNIFAHFLDADSALQERGTANKEQSCFDKSVMTPTFPSHLHIQAEYPVIGVFFYQYPKEQESFTLDLKEKMLLLWQAGICVHRLCGQYILSCIVVLCL